MSGRMTIQEARAELGVTEVPLDRSGAAIMRIMDVEGPEPPPLPLITSCDARDPIQDYAGHCPACHGHVWFSEEGEHGPLWMCPADFSPRNPHHLMPVPPVTGALKAVNGTQSNCWRLHGQRCPLIDMPLHAACHGGERPW